MIIANTYKIYSFAYIKEFSFTYGIRNDDNDDNMKSIEIFISNLIKITLILLLMKVR